jgi:hypothetical protein
MAEILYPGFLTDPKEYDKVASLWRGRWQQLITWAGQQQAWKDPWINNTFANGTPCLDANPIFSAVCPTRRLGVRVIQQEPADDPRELSFWTDTFGADDPLAIKELVISCVLTAETLNNVSDLLYQWITEEEVQVRRVGYPPTIEGRSRSHGSYSVFPTRTAA